MLKIIGGLVLGAIIAAAIGSASALVGIEPNNGYAAIDGQFVKGIRQGVNFTYQYGITAAGTNQATAFQLPASRYLLEVDTSGSGGATGVALPACVAGTEVALNNNTAFTIDVYPMIVNNLLTAAQDTINNTTSTTITTYATKHFMCAKNGVWGAQ